MASILDESCLRDLPGFRRDLLTWYRANRRPLPWREKPRPYYVWLSEIMSQQTRIAAVLKYYKRFLLRFPTIRHLAAASESDVLVSWSGLGYYRRARNLLQAAKIVESRYGGHLPRNVEEIAALPGIGRYTAHAIASICFGTPLAVVDGNVQRVFSRILGRHLRGRELWLIAQEMLDAESPGDFNQAVMELGATVCTPRIPACLKCPVKAYCAWGGPATMQAANPEPRKHKSAHVLLARKDSEIALVQRSASQSQMPGMWELPIVPRAPLTTPLLKVRHAITSTDWDVGVFASKPRVVPSTWNWVPLDQVPELPLTGLTRKILQKLELLS